MQFTKEKNIIIIAPSGASGVYRFDMSTGVMLGMRGAPIKTFACASDAYHACRMMEQSKNMFRMLSHIFNEGRETYRYRDTTLLEALAGCEKMDAIGVPYCDTPREVARFINDHFKEFTKYYQKSVEEGREINRRWVNQFSHYLDYEKAKSEMGAHARVISIDLWKTITNNGQRHYTENEWGIFAYYLVRNKLIDFIGESSAVSKVCNYLEWCSALGKTPSKENCFSREYVETKKTYELKKQEYDDARLRGHYEKHKKAFEFAFGDFVVVLPQGGQDIIDEGNNMHHCVGSYVDRVVDGRTFIVFVRHKNTPNECYLTAQVNTDGTLGQYYLAYDRHIHEEADYEFRAAFEKHLSENW